MNADLRVGALEETLTVTGTSPIVDTQSVRREVVLNNEILSTLPATRGYGSALAAVPALNSGGVAGANAPDGADDAADDVLHRARRPER